jgi:hypothetical protein
MDEKEMLNRIREAMAALDAAAYRIPIEERPDRLLHTRLQDAADALTEVREELKVRIDAQTHLRSVLSR